MFLENILCAYIVHRVMKDSEHYFDNQDDDTTTLKESTSQRFIPKIPEQPANTIKMVLGSKKRVIYISP
ncbi:MAG: hypothetical protein IKI57_01730 [Clostridia bacterium]|nr:hypothetical protein [Clostridia bacterium]